MDFFVRWVAAFVLLSVTYNPTPYNYTRWALGAWEDDTPLVVLAGLVLLVVYVVFMTAVLRGIGALGVILLLAVMAAAVWVAVDYRWLDLDDPGALTWVALGSASVVFAVGMYWGVFWRRISGQVEVDDSSDDL